jgi:cell wall-associated NlpC family hydrolase
MASRAGVNGAAIALMAAGVVVAYSGVRNATIADTTRSLIKGKPVVGSSTDSFLGSLHAVQSIGEQAGEAAAAAGAGAVGAIGAKAAGGVLNAEILAAVKTWEGVPYRFGGASRTGVDCSGLVTRVLTGLGLKLPNNTHTITTQFYVWGGAVTVPWEEMLPGDLICWTGHMGIAASGVDATGNATMWDAPHTGSTVQVQRIWRTPQPIVRRVLPQ